MRFMTILTAVLLLGTAASAQTATVTFDDLSPKKQAELIEKWKKEYRGEVSAPVAKPAPAVQPTTTTTTVTQTCTGPNCGATTPAVQPLILPGFQPFGGRFRPWR